MNEREHAPDASAERRGSPALEAICDPKWLAWYRLTPQERWKRSMEMWEEYVRAGGSLAPEPDPQSPFDFLYYPENYESAPGDDPAAEDQRET